MTVSKFPLIRFTFWFVIGIIIAFYTQLNWILSLVMFGLSCLVLGWTYFKLKQSFEPSVSFGIALYCVSFMLGTSTTTLHSPTFKKTHYTHNEANFETEKAFHLLLTEKLKNSKKFDRFYAKVISIDNQKASGKIVLNIKNNLSATNLNTGHQLLVKGRLLHHFKANNPNQFDYGKYIETKGVYGQIFTVASTIKIHGNTHKNLLYYTTKFRNTIIKNLQESGFKKETLAVVVALILGQQQDISPEILRDYQYAGAVHILSVSGLHVGFILLFITFLLKPIPNTTFGNSSKLIITIISLWLFAFVAGLAPSVVRSTVMFTFISIGMHLNRNTNSFHTTIVSMLIILLFEPMFLFDIGFQLSYLAVIFILWLQPLFTSFWQPNNKIVKYLWEIITVSFAAQIGTLPLSIYYFHQFPGLFFVTNLVLIPFLSIIMSLGTLLMIFAYFDFIPVFLSKTVESLITIVNWIIARIASLEHFIFTDIPLSFTLMIIAYGIIITWNFWFKKPSHKLLLLGLSSIILFQSILVYTKWKSEQKNEFFVFNVMKKSIFGIRNGNSLSVLTSEEITKNSFEDRMLHTFSTANYYSIKSIQPIKNIIKFGKTKIQIVDSTSVFKTTIQPDIIILRQSPKVNLDRLIETQQPKLIVADASNYKIAIEKWKKTCAKRKIPFHSTYEKGFYSMK
jgi:competence protein ComEC